MARKFLSFVPMCILVCLAGSAHAQTTRSAVQLREVRAHPAMAAKTKETVASLRQALQATSAKVGTPIPNFAPEYNWDRKADSIELVVYINAGDPYGVCISNLKKGDQVYGSSANGVCRFSRGDALSKIISLVGVVATVTAGVEAPEAAPYIPAIEGWVQKNLIPSNKGEQRDAYGQDPDTKDWCQDEGGVIICLPRAGGVLYRGGGNGSIPKKKPRTDDNVPAHVRGVAFFPVRGDTKHNTRTVDQDGEMFLAAWDGANDFGDNTGCYIVRLKITRADKVK